MWVGGNVLQEAEAGKFMSSNGNPSEKRHGEVGSVSPWIARFAPLVPAKAPVADIACGGGRHGRFFLSRGHAVVFADRDTSGVVDLEGAAGVEILEADFEDGSPWPVAGRAFGAVVVTNYLWRPLFPNLVANVAPGGWLLYETFAQGNEAFGRPRNPDFLLKPGELLEAVRGHLDVVAYEQTTVQQPKPAVIQHIAARRPG
jgi:SAM-dependent methyltransferase